MIEDVDFLSAGKFYEQADKITSEALGKWMDIVRMPELAPEIGLSFSRGNEEIAAFNKYLTKFEELARHRGGELAVYTHFYEERIEIIIQNGIATKAEGIKKMVKFLKKQYNFDEVILFAHENSSNDVPMLELAKEVKDKHQRSLGSCF